MPFPFLCEQIHIFRADIKIFSEGVKSPPPRESSKIEKEHHPHTLEAQGMNPAAHQHPSNAQQFISEATGPRRGRGRAFDPTGRDKAMTKPNFLP